MHHLGGVTHTAPRHVGDVQQAVDTAQIHESTVFGDVFDHTSNHRSLFQGGQQLLTLFTHAGFQYSTAAQYHVVAFAVEFDDLELHGFVFVRSQVLDGTGVDQRTGQEGADAIDQHGQAAFDFASGGAVDELARFQRFFQAQPGSQALGGVAREDGFAKAIFGAGDGYRNEVTSLDFNFALIVFEFFDRHIGFGLEAGIDHDVAVLDTHDFGGDDFTGAHFGAFQGFFKQGGKRFGHEISCLLPGMRLHHCSTAVGNRG